MSYCVVDLPPEYCQYHDEGCEFAQSCLNCPLPVCVYDEPGGKRKLLRKRRAAEMARLFTNDGKNTRELAQLFGVSSRTVQRALKMAFGDKTGYRPDSNKESTGCKTFHPHTLLRPAEADYSPDLLPSRVKELIEGVRN